MLNSNSDFESNDYLVNKSAYPEKKPDINGNEESDFQIFSLTNTEQEKQNSLTEPSSKKKLRKR